MVNKNISNRSFIYGDSDKDGVPNIDDKYPLKKGRNHQKDELLLTNELRLIRQRGLEHKKLLNKTTNQLRNDGYKVKGRIKGTTSTVNKLRRKYLYKIQDFAGVLIFVRNQDEAYETLDYLNRHFNIVEVENFYRVGHRTGTYKAIHALIEEGGNYVEVQIKTPVEYEQAQKSHTQYKLKDVQK